MITRRGFFAFCGAVAAAVVVLPGKEAVVGDTFFHSDSTPEDFHAFAEIFTEEIRATMSRPSFCSKIFKSA